MKYHSSVHLTDSLYCYIWQGMGNNCNTCLLTNVLAQGKPHILIDPGHIFNESREECFASLEESMAADAVNMEDIGLVINTHSHPDHCEANKLITSRNGAAVSISRAEDEFRRTTGRQMYTMLGMKPPDFQPDFYLEEGDLNIVREGCNIRIIATPGHSPGSVCLHLPNDKVLITGDVVFFRSVGRTDFPGGDMTLLRDSIDKLSQLDLECLVPGHNTEPRGVIRGDDVRRNFEFVRGFFY